MMYEAEVRNMNNFIGKSLNYYDKMQTKIVV